MKFLYMLIDIFAIIVFLSLSAFVLFLEGMEVFCQN